MNIQECATFLMRNHATCPGSALTSVIGSEWSILTSIFAGWSDHVHTSPGEGHSMWTGGQVVVHKNNVAIMIRKREEILGDSNSPPLSWVKGS